MILKAILLGLVAMLGHTNFLFGTNLLDRPLIMCTLTGLVMGDLKRGIIRMCEQVAASGNTLILYSA